MVHPICKQHQNITIKVIWEPYGEVFGDGLSCWNPPSKSHWSMKQFTTCLFWGGSFNQRVILPTCFLFNFNGFNLPKLKSRVFPCNQKKTNKFVCYCWWFKHPANQLRCEKNPIYKVNNKKHTSKRWFFSPGNLQPSTASPSPPFPNKFHGWSSSIHLLHTSWSTRIATLGHQGKAGSIPIQMGWNASFFALTVCI